MFGYKPKFSPPPNSVLVMFYMTVKVILVFMNY